MTKKKKHPIWLTSAAFQTLRDYCKKEGVTQIEAASNLIISRFSVNSSLNIPEELSEDNSPKTFGGVWVV